MNTRIPAMVVTLLLSVVPAAASANPSITAFEYLADGSVVVSVTIGGTGPYRFVLDTGSSRTVISTRLSQSLHRPAVAKSLMVTPAGDNVTNLVAVDELAIGGRSIGNVVAAVLPQEHYVGGRQIDGLIGQDVLAKEIYSVDYQRRVIEWHTREEDLQGIRLPLRVRDNRLLVSLAQRANDDQPIELIPDSGADALVLFAQGAGKLRFTMHEIGVLTSVSATRLMRRIVIEDLRIGDAHLRGQTAAIVPNRPGPSVLGDGLLPLHLFARVTFNVEEGFVIFHLR